MNLLLKDIESQTFSDVQRGCDLITFGQASSFVVSPELEMPILNLGTVTKLKF